MRTVRAVRKRLTLELEQRRSWRDTRSTTAILPALWERPYDIPRSCREGDLIVELLVERCRLTLCQCHSNLVLDPFPFVLACVGDGTEGHALGFRHRKGIF